MYVGKVSMILLLVLIVVLTHTIISPPSLPRSLPPSFLPSLLPSLLLSLPPSLPRSLPLSLSLSQVCDDERLRLDADFTGSCKDVQDLRREYQKHLRNTERMKNGLQALIQKQSKQTDIDR